MPYIERSTSECLYCATPLHQPLVRGRKRKFCDAACRVAYHRLHLPRVTEYSERCNACGSKSGNIVADVDIANKKRGYLCIPCLRIADAAKANAKRVRQVADYLDRTSPPRSFSNEMKQNRFDDVTKNTTRVIG